MKIQIICVGKLKENYLKDLISRYAKEIQKRYDFEIIELPDEKTPDNANQKEEDKIKEIEGTRILSRIPSDSFVIPLCIEGHPFSTEEFKKKWNQLKQDSISCVSFIIGGSLGLSPNVVSKGRIKLSFGNLTFPHQLMRLILAEQLSRL